MHREEDIFQAAAALPSEKRLSLLNEACAGQPALRARVEALLRAHDAAGFMEDRTTPAVEAMEGVGERSGDRIGRYRLLEVIGEGGFGVVWMAEQLEPVTRRVALKILKAGMDSKEVIARFEAERLRLFTDVCTAVSHAHQKGVIHRDLKPTNILVTLHADRPLVKVIDFGIAKAIEGRLTEHTLFTRFAQFVGTPAYMSPEQAALSDRDVDTRSDIYALGVLLYELLTGTPPFDTRTLVAAGYDEMRRILREEEPEKPSTRLARTLAATSTTSDRPRSKTQIPKPEILPDLDWIVMKAIEKDRDRRYETANGLRADVDRFLADEPVSAGPPTARYRFRKFTRRHRTAFRVAASLAAVLITATVVSTLLAIRAFRAEKDARAKATSEKLAREDAEAISRFLTHILESPDPAHDGRTVTVAEILDRAAAELENDLADHPERQARLLLTLASRTYPSFPMESVGQARRASSASAISPGVPGWRQT
ncbi:MAG: serine/threonine protein kinase [Verrucomicrobiales bacterium]